MNWNIPWVEIGAIAAVIAIIPLLIKATKYLFSKFQKQEAAIDEQKSLANRQAVLDQVKRTWIANYLETSLYGAALIDLGMTKDQMELVDNPWRMELRKVQEHTGQLLPEGTKIVEVFEDEQHALLILGEPGSGKTTMLLSLARNTIAQAEADSSKPIPVVFNLSSWGEKQPDFTDWVIDELEQKYGVPNTQGRYWIGENDLLLLLDGLDEVSAAKREACVGAINGFYQKNRLANQLVVCSRMTEYTALTTRLQLEAAVILQPLEPEQIEAYFQKLSKVTIASQLTKNFTKEQLLVLSYDHPEAQALYPQLTSGKEQADIVDLLLDFIIQQGQLDTLLSTTEVVDEFQALTTALQQDSILQELAQSPLMLSVMSLAYQGMGVDALQKYDTIDARSKHLWGTYIHRMLVRRGGNAGCTPEQTIHWLTWLAQKLKLYGQTEFLLENLQPEWVKTALQKKRIYQMIIGSGEITTSDTLALGLSRTLKTT